MPAGIDIIARGLAAKANSALASKADLVDGRVPASQLPSYVDEIIEVATYEDLPEVGSKNKIYLVLDTNKIYRWSGSTYVPIDAPAGKGSKFKPTWRTSSTVATFLSDVYGDSTVTGGDIYLGELFCSDLPGGIANGEAQVTVFDNDVFEVKIVKLDVFSSDVAPYRWTVMYINDEMTAWVTVPTKTSQLENDSGFLTSLSTIPASQVVYTKATTVTATVGGLKAGLVLTGKTVENIIERLVGAYVPPVFTPSSVAATYDVVNTRTGTAGGYIMGDTVKLQSVALTLSKGTDFDSFVSGKILQGTVVKHTLSSEELATLSSDNTVTINFTDATYTLPANKTSDSITYSVELKYNKKSYDANENIVINQVNFSINTNKVSAADSPTYVKLYYGSLPTGATITGVSPDGIVTYNDGATRTFAKKTTLGATPITTDDNNTMGVFVVDGALNDIKFMSNSDIVNWTASDKVLSYTRANDTVYTKTYKMYTNTIAVGSFTYELS